MTSLRFTCSYTRLRDGEGARPCGGRVTGRRYGEPKCLGHWVIDELLISLGGTERTRKTMMFVYFYGFLLNVSVVVGVVAGWEKASSLPLYVTVTCAFALAGLVISTTWEHSVGGRICVVLLPCAGVVTGVEGVRNLAAVLAVGPPPGERVEDILIASVSVLIGMVVLAWCVNFVLFYTMRYRLQDITRFVANGLVVLWVAAATVLAVASAGSSTGHLQMIILGFGALAVARGAVRLKKLAKRLRV